MRDVRQMLKHDFERLAFTSMYLLSVGATIATMGGLAALTNYCLSNQPLGLGSGFKLKPPLTAFATEVMRIQRAPVSTDTGSFDCGRFFRYDWTLWALQVVFLCIVGACWYRNTLRKYLVANAVVGAAVTAWHIYKMDYIITYGYWTQGELHTDGLMTCGGLLFTTIGNFLMFFAMAAMAEKEAPWAAHTAIGNGNGGMYGVDGKGSVAGVTPMKGGSLNAHPDVV